MSTELVNLIVLVVAPAVVGALIFAHLSERAMQQLSAACERLTAVPAWRMALQETNAELAFAFTYPLLLGAELGAVVVVFIAYVVVAARLLGAA